ncbi:MAG TPA: hypothetical protein VLX68_14160 [Chitinivibrionales bacterium]|nr:hypothetical protein [Chitinivibrionales bacterium]
MTNVIVNKECNLTTYVSKGVLAFDGIRDAIAAFYEGAPTLHIIWNLTEADLSNLSGDEVRDLAKTAKSHYRSREGGKTALVASSDADYGLARMYEVFTEFAKLPASVKVFRTMEEAQQWIRS